MILVVDDDPLFLHEVQSLVPHRQLYLARTGKQALELIGAIGQGFRIALVDLDLPGESGFVLIETLRRSFPDLPIIAISGVFQTHVLESALQVGANEVLSKPISEDWKATVDRFRAGDGTFRVN